MSATESSLNPVQQAIYAVLSVDPTIVSLVGSAPSLSGGGGALGAVFDSIPEPFKLRKYVLIGESIETPSDTFGAYGNEELITIHVVTEDTQDQNGWQLAKAIDARIVELLDGQPLAVTGRAFIYCNRDQAQLFIDDRWRHIARDFRIGTEEP